MSIVDKILKEAQDKPAKPVHKCRCIKGTCKCKHEEEELEEVSTPTVEPVEGPSFDYYSPEEKELKKKKSAREKEYREEGRYDGLY